MQTQEKQPKPERNVWLDPRVLARAEFLRDSLQQLEFAGVPGRKDLVEKGLTGVRYLSRFLTPRLELERSVILPFLEKRVPKLGPVIGIMLAEYANFETQLQVLRAILTEVKYDEDWTPEKIRKVRQTASYVHYILEQRLAPYSLSLQALIESELRQDEKELLRQRIRESEQKRARTSGNRCLPKRPAGSIIKGRKEAGHGTDA